ncbi:MAG TPA: flagellar biosynthesis protein FlhB [Deltaproteobacteria bacterium]|nr:flagellar biosynthesis protein FlhB [Deltaproteobacteria bacterium]
MAKENENGQQRTEQPTSKHIQDARDKGQVCKSIEVSTALLFLSMVIAFYLYIPAIARKLGTVVGSYLGDLSMWDGSSTDFISIFRHSVFELAILTLPLLGLFLIVGLASNIMQVGFIVSPEAVTPKLSKLNPLTGFKNRFMSVKSLEQLLKTLVIMLIIVWVSYRAIRRELPVYPPLMTADVGVIVLTIYHSAMRLLWDVLWIFVIIAMADYGFQKWQYTQDLMMTKQEIKDEFKQSEGNPIIKSRIRSIQMHMARKRMMRAVPKADVVITNPTHLAIALQYDRGKMIAPTVVAKGAGEVAEKIKQVARKAGVPIVENKPLAQALYKTVDIGDSIPEALYKAVAEILAYVYRLKAKIVR